MQCLRHTCVKRKLFIVYLNVKLTRAPALYLAVSGNPTQGSLLLITDRCKQLENGRRECCPGPEVSGRVQDESSTLKRYEINRHHLPQA